MGDSSARIINNKNKNNIGFKHQMGDPSAGISPRAESLRPPPLPPALGPMLVHTRGPAALDPSPRAPRQESALLREVGNATAGVAGPFDCEVGRTRLRAVPGRWKAVSAGTRRRTAACVFPRNTAHRTLLVPVRQ